MKIFFIGCVESSRQLLLTLLHHHFEVAGVVTKRRSAMNADFADLSPICEEHGIPCLYFDGRSWDAAASFAAQCAPDVLYCMGWSHLLPAPLLRIAPLGAVGFHPARLPQNRGGHPIVWALALGLRETASTFFMLEEQADTGDIVSQETVPIADTDTAAALYAKIMERACVQLAALTRGFEQGGVARLPQRGPSNTWRKRRFEDGVIDFRMGTRAICNLVRALSDPYPGACFLRQGQAYTVCKAQDAGDQAGGLENIEPGKVLAVHSSTSFTVKTADGAVKLLDCTPIPLKKGEYLL